VVVIAILPAGALIVGATLGLAAPVPAACWLTLLMLSWIVSITAFVRRAARVTLVAALIGFAMAAAALAQRATREALEPAILAQSAAYRVDVAGNAAMPIEIEAVIVGDAAATEFGAAFTVDVRRARVPLSAPAPGEPAAPGASALPGELAVPSERAAAEAGEQARPRGPAWRDSGGRVRVTVSGAPAREAAHLSAWRAGRRIRAPMLLNAPLPYRNFGTVDQEQRLALAGIRLFASIKSATLIDVIAPAPWWQEASAAARDYVRRTVLRFIGSWDTRSAAIVTAILIGDRAGLDAETESRLQRAGTYHVIAISGGNIAILVTLATTLLRLAGASPRRRAALAIPVLIIYAAIVGTGASVARATLGAVIYLIAHAMDHRSAAINILGVVAALMIALAPLEVIDPAFWLTCIATLAILVCAERIRTYLLQTLQNRVPTLTHARTRWLEPAVALLAATIAAESWLLPISAYAFSQMTFAGLALNFAAIPLMAIAQIAGLATLALSATALLMLTPLACVASFVTPLTWSAGYISHVAAYALVESARATDLFPHAALRMAPPPLWLVVTTEICGIACWLQHRPQRRLACLIAWTCALTLIAIAPPWPTGASPCATPDKSTAPASGGWLRITSLDVAQGDATLIRFPNGDTLMVDAGGSLTGTYDLGARIVSPALWALGLRRVQTLALTHGDRDHIGGASAVISDFSVREVWEGIPVTGHPLLAALQRQAWSQGALWRSARRDDQRTLALASASAEAGSMPAGGAAAAAAGAAAAATGVQLRVWSPPTPAWERRRVRNDDSIVLEIAYDRVSIVLPGDIGPDVERELAQRPWATGMLRILKAAHHGSARSSTAAFLNALAPNVAIISAGRGNHFGHPAAATLDRYRARNTEILRTDRDGAIELDTNGRDVLITTCNGRSLHMSAP
jgi:competence protein ComEC